MKGTEENINVNPKKRITKREFISTKVNENN
jgi:hypothetical protein